MFDLKFVYTMQKYDHVSMMMENVRDNPRNVKNSFSDIEMLCRDTIASSNCMEAYRSVFLEIADRAAELKDMHTILEKRAKTRANNRVQKWKK